jgi:hypothetical protein
MGDRMKIEYRVIEEEVCGPEEERYLFHRDANKPPQKGDWVHLIQPITRMYWRRFHNYVGHRVIFSSQDVTIKERQVYKWRVIQVDFNYDPDTGERSALVQVSCNPHVLPGERYAVRG